MDGNARSASFCACADSYELGRKLAWSELDTEPMLGASGTITATAAIQTAITRQGWAVTILPAEQHRRSCSTPAVYMLMPLK